MKKIYIILLLLSILLNLGGCVKKHPTPDEEIEPITYEEENSSHLPQSEVRCEPLDELEILESFPLKKGEEGKYPSLNTHVTTNVIEDGQTPEEHLIGRVAYGKASWYGKRFHGRKTASGEPYDMYDNTAAHKQLPFNSLVKITYLETGKSEVVRINDRGPYHGKRIIDVSYATAQNLGLIPEGVGEVKLEIYKIGFDPRCTPSVTN